MKFTIRKASNWRYEAQKEFTTLEELVKWLDENAECGIKIRREDSPLTGQKTDKISITICDDYME